MLDNIKNNEGGFIKLIILIVVVLITMKYFNISISSLIDWVKDLINSVL